MSDPRHRLQLGNFVLADGKGPLDSGRGYLVEVTGDDFQRGNPTRVQTVVESLVADGAVLAANGRFDGRSEATVGVIFTGDSRGLAQAEADLSVELNRRNELWWTPPDGLSEPSVLDVMDSVMVTREAGADLDEVLRGERSWTLTLWCAPLVRASVLSRVVSSAVAAPAETLLDDCTSVSGWETGLSTRAAVTKDGRSALRLGPESPSNIGGPNPWQATIRQAKTFNITRPYFFWETKLEGADPSGGIPPTLGVTGGGGHPVQSEGLPDGWVRHYYDVRNAQGSRRVELRQSTNRATDAPVQMWLDTVKTVQELPSLSTRSLVARIANEGSQRAPARIAVEGVAAGSLGDVLLYTAPDDGLGFTPGLRRFRVSGQATSADANSISGRVEMLDPGTGSFRANISQRLIKPGFYEVYFIGRYTGSGQPATFPRITASSTTFAEGEADECVLRPSGLDMAATFKVMGQLPLPHRPSPPESNAELSIWVTAPNADWEVDDVLLAPIAESARERNVTIVTPGARRLWTLSPSVDEPDGALYSGTAANRSDALSVLGRAAAVGAHHVERGGSVVYVAASGVSAPPTVTAEYFRTATHHISARRS